LLNLAKQHGTDFNFLLGRFAVERLLYRLGRSEYRDNFILKGAMLFHLRAAEVPYRATSDLDLSGKGASTLTRVEQIFGIVCAMDEPEDGLTFLSDKITADRIKADDKYSGVRVRVEARLGTAKIPLQIDVGFGDAVLPAPTRENLAVLLEFPAPTLLVYPWEAVVAEKFNALVVLGMDNSRMKDYFDLRYLAQTKSFNGETLAGSIHAVFLRRDTPLPKDVPEGLRFEFATDPVKQTQWRAFRRRLRLENIPTLEAVVAELCRFLLPPVEALVHRKSFTATWLPSGPWRRK
jgi:predicted nucleotidyltransferase component of viral defense system